MKRILAVIIAIGLSTGVLVGCETESQVETNADNRFTVIHSESVNLLGYIMILKDEETGKSYLFCKDGYGGGLCELDEGENENDETLGN